MSFAPASSSPFHDVGKEYLVFQITVCFTLFDNAIILPTTRRGARAKRQFNVAEIELINGPTLLQKTAGVKIMTWNHMNAQHAKDHSNVEVAIDEQTDNRPQKEQNNFHRNTGVTGPLFQFCNADTFPNRNKPLTVFGAVIVILQRFNIDVVVIIAKNEAPPIFLVVSHLV